MALVFALINKETLHYICEKKRVTTEFIKTRTRLDDDKIALWLDTSNSSLPTIKQAKKIASCLHIPFAALYMNPGDIPIKSIPNIKNLRTFQGAEIDDSALNVAVIDLLSERDFLLQTYSDFEISVSPFCPVVPQSANPVEWADALRNHFSIKVENQFKCKSPRQFFLYLKEQIENGGVFIQCFTDVPLECARGLAIYDPVFPVIGINENDRPPAKSFSIVHELVHLYKRDSSYCNNMVNSDTTAAEEVFCNAVAGELLVPERSLKIFLGSGVGGSQITEEKIKKIANHFSVSREVVIRRLYDLEVIDKVEYGTYSELLRQEFENEKEQSRIARQNGLATGIPRNIGRETVDRMSSTISKLLYQGYTQDYFSKQDIARHLDIDQKHINSYLLEVSKWSK